ncbi:MAG: GTP-binding protein [Clostridiales bacterium]|nr:GTP-binding protein [Clostridiales bacterium]
MAKVNIISGFLGAGKTTLIKKLVKEAYSGEKIVIIENEFGEIGIDGGFLQEAGVQITEMNSGCICCSLVGDFGKALTKVLDDYAPDRIIIEPSGVGKLSDVVKAVLDVHNDRLEIESLVTVADANRCKMYIKNFGEFYKNQIESAGCVILSHTGNIKEEKLSESIKLLREINPNVHIVSTDWDKLTGVQIIDAVTGRDTLETEIEKLSKENGHHHHHDDEHHECHGEHRHHDDEHHECCGRHHDGEHHECHGEHHHHDDEHHECCGHHHNGEHHHHHDADEIFDSWGIETAKSFDYELLKAALSEFDSSEKYGMVIRAKGIVSGKGGEWIHFDYIPGDINIRTGAAAAIGRICVIGSKIHKDEIKKLLDI